MSSPNPHSGSSMYASTCASSAEPVEVGAGRYERRVEHGQLDRGVEVQCGFEQVQRGGAGQRHGVELGAVPEQVLLTGERSEAVRDQRKLQRRVGGTGDLGRPADVGDQLGPAGLADRAGLGAFDQGGAVATVVVGVHDVAAGGERLSQRCVPEGVFADAVDDLGDRAGWAFGVPAVGGDGHAPRTGKVDTCGLLGHAGAPLVARAALARALVKRIGLTIPRQCPGRRFQRLDVLGQDVGDTPAGSLT